MGKTGNPDDSGASGTSDDGQNNEEGDLADNDTLVINDPADDVGNDPSDTMIVDGVEVTTESTAETNAVIEGAIQVPVTVTGANADPTDKTGNNYTITWIGDRVNGSTAELPNKDTDLQFRVEPADGRSVTGVKSALGDASLSPLSADVDGVYTISYANIVSGGKINPVKIEVTTDYVSYSVTLHASGYSVYELNTSNAASGAALSAAVTMKTSDPVKRYGVVMDAGKVFQDIKMDDQAITATAGTISVSDVVKPAYIFNMDPKVVAEKYKTTTSLTVTVGVRDAYVLTVGGLAKEPAGGGYAVATYTGSDAAKYHVYNGTNEGFGSAGATLAVKETETDKLAKSLAFRVKAKTANFYKDITVTAKAGADSGKDGAIDAPSAARDVTVTPVTTADEEANGKLYTIALNQEALKLTEDTALEISVSAALDEGDTNKANVRTITFKAANGDDLKHIESITYGASSGEENTLDLTKTTKITTTADSLKFKITPAGGYVFTKGTSTKTPDSEGVTTDDSANGKLSNATYIVKINEKGKQFKTGDTAPAFTGDRDKTYEADAWNAGGNPAVAKAIELTLADKTNATDANKFYDTAVEITVGVVPDDNLAEKLVQFTDNLKVGGKNSFSFPDPTGISYDDTLAANSQPSGGQWEVAKSLKELTFVVTSDIKPAVTLAINGADSPPPLTPIKVEGNVYTYTIPTTTLHATTNAIVISKDNAAKTVKLTMDADTFNSYLDKSGDYSNGLVYKIATNAEGDGTNGTIGSLSAGSLATGQALTSTPNIGDKVILKFKAKAGAKFTEASYTMGTATGKAAIDEKTNVATFEVVVTDDLNVSVKAESEYEVVIQDQDKLDDPSAATTLSGKEGKYTVDYDEQNLVVSLKNAGVTTPGVSEDIYNVVLKAGGKNAATKIVIDNANHKATIAKIDKEDYGKTLTIEVTRKADRKKYTAELKVSAVSDGVTVTNLATNKVMADGECVDVMPDSILKFKVAPLAGANLADLNVEIRSEKANAAPSDDTAARALIKEITFAGGEVSVNVAAAKEAQGKVKLCVYNKKKTGDNSTAALKGGTVVLNITDPLVKSGKVKGITLKPGVNDNKNVNVYANVTFSDKKVTKPTAGELWYKVEFSNIRAELIDTTGKLETETKVTKDLEALVPVDGAYTGDLTKPFTAALVKSYKDKNNVDKEVPGEIYADATVTLVQSMTGDAPSDSDAIVGPSATITVNTVLPLYETKLTMTTVNGATVYTGQIDTEANSGYDISQMAKVATPKFGKETSYTGNVSVQLINTKTNKPLTDSVAGPTTYTTYGGNYIKAAADTVDGSVYVGVDKDFRVNSTSANERDFLKNLGVKVIANAPGTGYAATAVVKLKVVQGIFLVEEDESKAVLPETILVDSKGNAKTLKLTTKLNGGNAAYKPAKNTLNWSFDLTDATNAMKAAVSGSKPQIAIKNGSLTIKGYQMDKSGAAHANEIVVKAAAADYAGSVAGGRTETWTFTITDQPQTIGDVVVVNSAGKVYNTLKAEDFTDGSGLYLAAVEPGKKPDNIGAYNKATDFMPATFKVSGGAVKTAGTAVTNNMVELSFVKPGKATIVAKTVDGGKAKDFKKEIAIDGFGTLGLCFEDAYGDVTTPDEAAAGITYSGGANQKYRLYLSHKDGNAWNDEANYKNVKVTVKGGKFVADSGWKKNMSQDYLGYVIVVSDKSGQATVTLADTANKQAAKVEYRITNATPNVAMKAPSIKLYETLSSDGKTAKKIDAKTVKITWQITAKDQNNFVDKYVMLTPDFATKYDTKKCNAYDLLADYDGSNVLNGYAVIRKIDEYGRFDLDGLYLNRSGGVNARMIATVGEMADGRFVAAAKDVKVNFSVGARRWNTNISMTTSYTLDPAGAGRAKLEVKTDPDYRIIALKNVVKKTKEKNAYDDHENKFLDYFELKADNGGAVTTGESGTVLNQDTDGNRYATIGFKSDLTVAQIENIAKEDLSGYITVDNGSIRKDFQIKISLKEKKLTGKADPVFAESKNTVDVEVTVLDGKNRVNVSQDTLVAVADKGGFAESVRTNAAKNLVVTSKGGFAEGKYDVVLRVVPDDAAFWAGMSDKTGDGAKVIDAADILKTYGVDVPVKIEVKPLADKKAIEVKNLNLTLNGRTAYNETAASDPTKKAAVSNGYKLGAANSTGEYIVDVPYTISMANGSINTVDVNAFVVDDARNAFKVGDKNYEIVKADAAVAVVDGKDQGVIRLHVSKEAIQKQTGSNPLAKWKSRMNVPLKVMYKNGSGDTAYQTLNFKVTLPAEPMTFADVKAELAKAENAKLLKELQTDNSRITDTIVTNLKTKVKRTLMGMVPADSDIMVGDPTSNATWDVTDSGIGDYTGNGVVMQKGRAEIKVVLTDNAAPADPAENRTFNWKETYSIGIINSFVDDADNDVKAIETAIVAIRTADVLSATITNNTTSKALEDAVLDNTANAGLANSKSIRQTYLGTGKGNISVSICYFEMKRATAQEAGYVKAKMRVKDLATGKSVVVNLAGPGDNDRFTITTSAAAVNNINEALEAIYKSSDSSGALNDAGLTEIYKQGGGDEALTKKLVLEAANTAAANPAIKISIKEGSWTYKKVTASVAGQLKFILLVDLNGRVKELDLTSVMTDITAGAGEAAKIKTPTEVAALVKAEFMAGDAMTSSEISAFTSAITNATSPTEALEKAKIKDLIDTEAQSVVGTDGTGGTVYGYTYKIDSLEYRKATANTEGSIRIKLTVAPYADPSKTYAVALPAEIKLPKVGTNLTRKELEENLDSLATTGFEVSVSDFAGISNATDALAKVNAQLTAMGLDGSSQTGEMKGVTAAATLTAGTEASAWSKNADQTVGTLTKVNILVKRDEGANSDVVIYKKTLDVKINKRVPVFTSLVLSGDEAISLAANQSADVTKTYTVTPKDQDSGALAALPTGYTYTWTAVKASDSANDLNAGTAMPGTGSDSTATVTNVLTVNKDQTSCKVDIQVTATNGSSTITSNKVTVTVTRSQ